MLTPFLPLAAAPLTLAALAQDPAAAPQASPAEPEEWEFALNAFWSEPPGSEDRLTTVLYADRGPLHFELRYNYEDLETVAFFGGWTFELGGEAVTASLTPMLGLVAGNTEGIAPGLEAEVNWKKLTWYTEMEYLFDTKNGDDDYFYEWSTLTWGFTDWLSAGLVTERTKIVDTAQDVQYGLAVQFNTANGSLALYAYNPGDEDDEYGVVSFSMSL